MGQTAAPGKENSSIVIRRASRAEAEACGRICYEAFGSLAAHHNFPPDFPGPEVPIAVLTMMFSHPSFFCVVAEQSGRVIGRASCRERV